MRDKIKEFLRRLLAAEKFDEQLEMSVWKNTPWGDISVTQCTSSAKMVAWLFNGKVYGYPIADKDSEDLAGYDSLGHDFAVIDDRWLVDYWSEYVNESGPGILDMQDERDMAIINKRYKPKEFWGELELVV